MSETETRIAKNYTSGDLLDRITTALLGAGVDLEHATQEDLKGGDEFHVGGAEATQALLAQLDLSPDMTVVDIGSGLGGAARRVAMQHGCRVTGVDVTPEFVETANALTKMVGLNDMVTFRQGSGVALPLEDSSADLALMIHVGMNISDKPALFAETARVLKPGGTFAVYDVMIGARPGDLPYPMPWAETSAESFVAVPGDYHAAATAAGLELIAERDRGEYGALFMTEMLERMAAEGPPPVGPHLFMGETGPLRLQNATRSLAERRISPVEMIFRAPG